MSRVLVVLDGMPGFDIPNAMECEVQGRNVNDTQIPRSHVANFDLFLCRTRAF